MSLTLNRMAAKKKPSGKHKPSRMVRLPEPLAVALEEMSSEQFNTLTDQVKIAVREYLERNQRLPKPARPQS